MRRGQYIGNAFQRLFLLGVLNTRTSRGPFLNGRSMLQLPNDHNLCYSTVYSAANNLSAADLASNLTDTEPECYVASPPMDPASCEDAIAQVPDTEFPIRFTVWLHAPAGQIFEL